jgi:competence factor transporting protein
MIRVNRYKKYYTPQVDEMDCGVAALNMILKYNKSDYSLSYLRQLTKTNLDGTSALGIVTAANDLGFNTKAIQADISLLNIENLPFPFIAHVLNRDGFYHYYVVFRVTNSELIIGDPDPRIKLDKISRREFEKVWSGVAIFISPSERYKPLKQNKGNMLDFIPIIMKQKGLIFNIIAAAILITIISITGSYFLQSIIDLYIPNAMIGTLGIISIGLVVAYIFQSIFTYGQNFLMAVLGQRLSIDVTLGYIRHLFELPMSFFSTRRTGEIVSRFNDASKIIDAIASTIITVFLDIWIVIIVGIVLSIQSFKLFFISLLAVPVYILIVYSFKRAFTKLNQKAMESNAVLSSSIIEDLKGIETIKSLTGESTSFNKIDYQFTDLLKKTFSYTKVDQFQQVIKMSLKLILNVAILWFGSILVMKNELTMGQLFTYNALLSYFTNPLESIINLQPKIQTAKVANNRLNEVFLVESEFKKKRKINELIDLDGDISLKNVTFKYGYGLDILKNISFHISKNEKVTIVGMSGSGKSTLVKLLVGFFDVDNNNGKILINNHNINDVERLTLRKYINYIPQEPFIFSGTIIDNLTLGSRDNIDIKEIKKACDLAEITDDIKNLSLGFGTKISENGEELSGGQKQRIAIARALLSPSQVLIFDESTSNLDTVTEHKIVQNLIQMKNKTIIFVAHRMSIARQTQNVIVLDHGRVVEKGIHEELIKKKGYYSTLINQ